MQVQQEAIDTLHQQYFSQIRELWNEHQPTFPGYEDVELVLYP